MEFLSWEVLGTTAGITAAITAATQIIKQFVNIDPKWIALILAAVITFAIQIVSSDFAFERFFMSALNALFVTGAVIGSYEGVLKHVVNDTQKGAQYEKRNRRI